MEVASWLASVRLVFLENILDDLVRSKVVASQEFDTDENKFVRRQLGEAAAVRTRRLGLSEGIWREISRERKRESNIVRDKKLSRSGREIEKQRNKRERKKEK